MFRSEMKKIMDAYKKSAIIKSFLFSSLVSLLIIAPFVALTINLMLIYIRFIYLYLVIIALLFSGLGVLISYGFYQTLKTYPSQTSEPIDMAYLWKVESLISSTLIFIISIILILLIAPTYII